MHNTTMIKNFQFNTEYLIATLHRKIRLTQLGIDQVKEEYRRSLEQQNQAKSEGLRQAVLELETMNSTCTAINYSEIFQQFIVLFDHARSQNDSHVLNAIQACGLSMRDILSIKGFLLCARKIGYVRWPDASQIEEARALILAHRIDYLRILLRLHVHEERRES